MVSALALLVAVAACAVGCAQSRKPAPVDLRPRHREPELFSVRHRVEPGQTLYRIATTYGVSPEEVAWANGIQDPTGLKVGQELVIPGARRKLEVRPKGAEPDDQVQDPPAPDRRAALDRAFQSITEEKTSGPKGTAAPASAPPRQGALDWPLRGVLYARFGQKGRELHDGIDLAAPRGTPVKTAAAGKVLFAGEQQGYGLLAIIEHRPGLVTLYAHNDELRVWKGQAVKTGQVIATVGESGRTSGPHLHFEVRQEGKPVNPLKYLPPAPAASR